MKKIALIAAVAAGLAFAHNGSAATYAPVGPQNDVALSTVIDGGWTMIYRGAYRDQVLVTDVFKDAQKYVMLAGVNNETGMIDLLAWTTLADVLTVTSYNETRVSNGAGWYYNNFAMGFAGPSDVIRQNTADLGGACFDDKFDPVPDCVVERDRLSWTTGGDVGGEPLYLRGGFRSGSNLFLLESTAFDRVVFTTDSIPGVPEPATWAMMIAGFGLAGAALRRRPTGMARAAFSCSRSDG